MAHVMKIKSPAVSAMVGHYERQAELDHGYRRENIDPSRTELNYNLRPSDVVEDVKLAELQHEQLSGKAVRKDANVLMDWVVTMPKDCPSELSREFFESVTTFIEQRYGKGNVVGAYVHMDEATPHVHVPVIPAIKGRLQASKMVNRADLKSFHGDLGKHVDSDLGFHVSVELDEEQRGEKQLSALNQSEYIAAKQRLECLRRKEEELSREVEEREVESTQESISGSIRTLCKAQGDGKRAEALAGEVESLKSQIGGLEREHRQLEREKVDLSQEIRKLEGGILGLGEGLENIRDRVAKAMKGLDHVVNTLSAYAQAIARKLGVPVMDEMRARINDARRAAAASSISRNWERDRGRAR